MPLAQRQRKCSLNGDDGDDGSDDDKGDGGDDGDSGDVSRQYPVYSLALITSVAWLILFPYHLSVCLSGRLCIHLPFNQSLSLSRIFILLYLNPAVLPTHLSIQLLRELH